MKNIIVSGISGKMGTKVYESAKDAGLNVVCGIDKDCYGNFDCPVYPSFKDVKDYTDVVIDFSSPTNLGGLLGYCLKNKTPLVIATTGFSKNDEKTISDAAKTIPVLKIANTSLTVNYFIKTVAKMAKALASYDVEIIERHHNHKKDAPSGTAKMLVKAIKQTRKIESISYGRHGTHNRKSEEIGVHSIRGGSVVGEHEVCFYGKYDEIRIIHSAQDKKLFSDGAVYAAYFIEKQKVGLYTEKDLFSF